LARPLLVMHSPGQNNKHTTTYLRDTPLAALVNGSLSEPADSGQRDVQFMRSSVALAAFRLVAERNGEGLAKNWLISANGMADEAPVDLLYQGRYSDVMAAAETLVLSQ
jgi:hypothetical protein